MCSIAWWDICGPAVTSGAFSRSSRTTFTFKSYMCSEIFNPAKSVRMKLSIGGHGGSQPRHAEQLLSVCNFASFLSVCSTAASNMVRNIYKLLLLLPPVCWAWVELRTPSYVQIWTFNSDNKCTWKEAQTICRQNHTDLATVRNPEEKQLISPGTGWIGLYRSSSDPEWRWSRGDEAVTFTCWDTQGGQPDDGGDCATQVWKKGIWQTSNCDTKRNFLCSEERLVLVKEKKSWEEAVEHCRALEAEGQNQRYELATLLTPEDLSFARERAEGATTEEVWTGLRHLAGHWLWVDGEQVLDDQLPGCPAQGSCGALLIGGSQPIHTSSCELRKNFFCYNKHQLRQIKI